MIIGVGIDIVSNSRVKSIFLKYGARFLNRVFTEKEIAYCLSHDQPHQYLAARLAVKEAVSKAFGYGIGKKFQWKNIEIGKDGGTPKVIFHNEALRVFSGLECHCLISLSHERDNSVALAVLESWE